MSVTAANIIIDRVASKTDRVILFHSAAGKDSIVLLDLLTKKFKEVQCVFMYLIKQSYLDKYIIWAEKKYPNAKFEKIPHFVLSEMIKKGNLGLKPNPKQKLYTLSMLTAKMREQFGIDWVCFGFKQNDGITRRVMLRGYEMNGFYEKGKKFFPLSEWKNRDCLAYIKKHNLLRPIKYSNQPSSDMELDRGDYLLWCKNKYPDTYENIIKQFPMCEAILYDYETRQKNKSEKIQAE